MAAPPPSRSALRLVLRAAAILVTLASIVFMLFPDRFGAPLLHLGLGGQFVVGAIILAALAYEIIARVS